MVNFLEGGPAKGSPNPWDPYTQPNNCFQYAMGGFPLSLASNPTHWYGSLRMFAHHRFGQSHMRPFCSHEKGRHSLGSLTTACYSARGLPETWVVHTTTNRLVNPFTTSQTYVSFVATQTGQPVRLTQTVFDQHLIIRLNTKCLPKANT